MDDPNTDVVPFTYVQHGKRNRRSRPAKKRSLPPPSFSELLSKTNDTLLKTGWSDHLVQCLDKFLSKHRKSFFPVKGLCLGLGSPMESLNARAQLSGLIRICKHFGLAHDNVRIYDPVFTPVDRQGLADMQFIVETEDKNGEYDLGERPLLLFMPHCDVELHERLLRRNFSPESLSNVLMIANDLSVYVESKPRRIMETEAPAMARLVPYLLSSPLPECRATPGAFNSMAFQIVNIQADASDLDIHLDEVPSDLDQEIQLPGLHPVLSGLVVLPAMSDAQFWQLPQISANLS